jgi:putative nucleotidyltransferase with HDIG domain
VAVQLLKLVDEPEVPLARIVGLLRTDAVLSAEVLCLANSPLFFRGSEVRSILHALALLGLNRVRALVVTSCMRSTVDSRRSSLALPVWRHSLTTAVFCEQLSSAVGLERDNCYTAGIIHDIGRLALLRAFPDYETELRAAIADRADILEAERRIFGMDHAEAGRWLLGQWGCPIELQNVAALHEQAPGPHMRDSNLIGLVRAASQMADFIGASIFGSIREPDLAEIAALLPAGAGQLVLSRFTEIADRVLTDVNGVELTIA